MSLTLYIIQLWVFVLIPSYCKKKLLWEELNNALVYVYSNMSLGLYVMFL